MRRTHPNLRRCGEDNGFARFSNARAQEIRELYAAGGRSLRALARELGLPYTTTRNVALGLTYCDDDEDEL